MGESVAGNLLFQCWGGRFFLPLRPYCCIFQVRIFRYLIIKIYLYRSDIFYDSRSSAFLNSTSGGREGLNRLVNGNVSTLPPSEFLIN